MNLNLDSLSKLSAPALMIVMLALMLWFGAQMVELQAEELRLMREAVTHNTEAITSLESYLKSNGAAR